MKSALTCAVCVPQLLPLRRQHCFTLSVKPAAPAIYTSLHVLYVLDESSLQSCPVMAANGRRPVWPWLVFGAVVGALLAAAGSGSLQRECFEIAARAGAFKSPRCCPHLLNCRCRRRRRFHSSL